MQGLHLFSAQHLAHLLWSMARLGFREDREHLRCAGDAFAGRAREGSPQDLASVAWAVAQLGPEYCPGCLEAAAAEASSRLPEFGPPSVVMLSEALQDASWRRGPPADALDERLGRMSGELLRIFQEGLPRPRGVAAPADWEEYRRSLQEVGVATLTSGRTQELLARLRLSGGGRPWGREEAAALPGWHPGRRLAARRFQLRVGEERLEDAGTVVARGAAAAGDFAVGSAPGRRALGGEAPCRALLDAQRALRGALQAQELAPEAVEGSLELYASGVPCLSDVGIAAQFQRCYPRVTVCFTFADGACSWEGLDIAAVPH